MSSIKKTLMKQGMKLMTDPRVMKLMQDERVMKAVMQMMNVPGKVQTLGELLMIVSRPRRSYPLVMLEVTPSL